jgi:hypothetical protein
MKESKPLSEMAAINKGARAKNNLDYFHGNLAKGAKFCGSWDIPYVESSGIVPNKVISFSKAIKSTDYDSWVMFYEYDTAFQRFWNNPEKYLPTLKKYKGVVGPDFSLYGDYPLALQIFNTYRSRVLTHWLKCNGVCVIPNVRWSTEYTYQFCFDGLRQKDIVFVGSHGCSKRSGDKHLFEKGLKEMIKRIDPAVICIYGTVSSNVSQLIESNKIKLIVFESEFSLTHEER